MSAGILTLIPTPIDDETLLCPYAKELLEKACINDSLIFVEEHKCARRRWLRYGLPREAIEKFELYNEHTHKEQSELGVKSLKSGRDVILMSDCGLPAFCDPGRTLVEKCHERGLKVTSAPFANSIALSVALSGFPHNKFTFEGFVPADREKRSKELKRILADKGVSIIMDTPYRMNKLIDELCSLDSAREVFIGLDLNSSQEKLLRGSLKQVSKKLEKDKREFVLVIGPKK